MSDLENVMAVVAIRAFKSKSCRHAMPTRTAVCQYVLPLKVTPSSMPFYMDITHKSVMDLDVTGRGVLRRVAGDMDGNRQPHRIARTRRIEGEVR